MSTFPSVISTISDPAATNKLNSPSHSSIESAQNDGIKKLETFVGTLSSAVGTLVYDIRATASDGGGHVQVANKGGTGQTAYTKGDILVASSASVLSKLAVGSNDQALVADSAQAAGVKWAGVATATQIQNQTYTYARASVMSGSVYGVKLSENPSILSDGLGLVIKFPAAPTSSAMALQVFTSSSGSVAARIKTVNLTDPNTTAIVASMIGVLEFDSVSSVFQLINPLNSWAVMQVTKNSADASSVQSIAHGLGVTPRFVRITARPDNDAGSYAESTTIYNGTDQKNISTFGSGSVKGYLTSAFILNSTADQSGNRQQGDVTFNATNIIITWTKTGSPTGGYELLIEAI